MPERILENGARILELPEFVDGRGGLTYIEQSNHVPFDIKRVYHIYDVPPDQTRGEHAHEDLEQVLIAVSGKFTINIDDGRVSESVTLNKENEGLYLPSMTWREMKGFSEHAVCLVLASEYYDEEDYIDDYERFRALTSRSS